jgi:hypothetical protein
VLSRVLRTIRERSLVTKGDRVLVAVSGGPDSTALLHGLAKVAPRLGISLAAACVDHRLRPESAEEAREVQRRCQGMGIACEILEVDVGSARKAHVSTQEAARNVRLAALEARPPSWVHEDRAWPHRRRPGRNRALPHRARDGRGRAGRHSVPARTVHSALARRAACRDSGLPGQAQDRFRHRSLQREPPLRPLAHSPRRAAHAGPGESARRRCAAGPGPRGPGQGCAGLAQGLAPSSTCQGQPSTPSIAGCAKGTVRGP